ncbi:Uncharacterised protein [Mycobacteroides abscessus subsp. abscessus]|nr:Uncharacterised protein [Mycobacteroides abscessus subsp. abscessus]
MGEGLLLPHDLGLGDLLHQGGGAVDDVGELQLELAAGPVHLPVDEVVELLGVLIQLVGGLLPVRRGGEREGRAVLGEQVRLDPVPPGPVLEHLGVGDLLVRVCGEVLHAGVHRGVQVPGLLDAEGLRGGLDPLVVLAGQRVQLLGALGVPGGVGLRELLGGGQHLTDLVLGVAGVVGDGPVLGGLRVVADLHLLALGHRELAQPHEVPDHVGLARSVVGALLQGGGELGGGAGADVLLLGLDLQLVLRQDLQLIGLGALVGDLELHLPGLHLGGLHLAGVVRDGDLDGLGVPGAPAGAGVRGGGVLGVVGAAGHRDGQQHGGGGAQGAGDSHGFLRDSTGRTDSMGWAAGRGALPRTWRRKKNSTGTRYSHQPMTCRTVGCRFTWNMACSST